MSGLRTREGVGHLKHICFKIIKFMVYWQCTIAPHSWSARSLTAGRARGPICTCVTCSLASAI